FSSRRRHTRVSRDWSSDVCSSDLGKEKPIEQPAPEDHLTPAEAAAIEAEVEPHSREEDLPVSPVDPVAPVEMETAGGPAADDAQIGRAAGRQSGHGPGCGVQALGR